jgi:hypothetical protein
MKFLPISRDIYCNLQQKNLKSFTIYHFLQQCNKRFFTDFTVLDEKHTSGHWRVTKIKTLKGATTLSITTLSIITLRIMGLFATLSIIDTEYKWHSA